MASEAAVCREVRFEFFGGPRDGLIVRSPLYASDYDEGAGLLWQTDGGRPGTVFWMPSEYALSVYQTYGSDGFEQLGAAGYRFHGHRYEVFVRWQREHARIVRARHLGYEE